MIETGVLHYEDALEKAKEFLAGLGLPAMKESYYVISDHLCTINFSYEQELEDGSVTCYPDLIKVTIELSQGGAVEYDASGYLMNHRARAPRAHAVTGGSRGTPQPAFDGTGIRARFDPHAGASRGALLGVSLYCRGN